jgi:hypothetical protein
LFKQHFDVIGMLGACRGTPDRHKNRNPKNQGSCAPQRQTNRHNIYLHARKDRAGCGESVTNAWHLQRENANHTFMSCGQKWRRCTPFTERAHDDSSTDIDGIVGAASPAFTFFTWRAAESG